MTKKTNKRIGLAVSGGADSIALMYLMNRLKGEFGFEAFVLHFNHGVDAEDSPLVERHAKALNLPFFYGEKKVVRKKGESLEMACRRERLAFFARMTTELSLDAVATGHHADDLAETFLMRVARGSGPEGLAGLKPYSEVNGIRFIRPLLGLKDAELKNFLREQGISWHEDPSNIDTSIVRNNVRHVILPFLKEHLDAKIVDHIVKTCAILRGEMKKSDLVEPCIKSPEKKKKKPPSYILTIEPAEGYVVRKSAIGELPAICEMNASSLVGRTLEVRFRKDGDRISPVGMKGHSRKIQDVFVTAKVPVEMRDTLPLLVDASTDEVLWIPGWRISETVAVKTPSSPSLRLTLETSRNRSASNGRI